MEIKFIVGVSGYTENFLVRVWEAASDGVSAWLDETTLVEKNGAGVPTPGAGHQVSEPVIFSGRDNVTHIIRIYGVTSSNLYAEFRYEAMTALATVFMPLRFKVGDGGPDTPAADQDTCTTPELMGLTTDEFIIHRNNYGDLHPATHFTKAENSDTWQLVNPDQFGLNEEFTIKRLPQVITTVVNDSVVGKWFGGFLDVAANTNYDAAHLRKLIRFAGQCTYTFQLADTIPIGYAFVFQNFGTPSGTNTCTVQFLNGNLKWGNTTKTTIDLPLYFGAAFVWDGTQWNVIYYYDSRVVNATTTPAGTVMGVGLHFIGDIAAGDPVYTVTHNLNITGEYHVWLQVKSNDGTTAFRDNKLCHTWWHETVTATKKNQFKFSVQEISGETQNVSVVWVILKA